MKQFSEKELELLRKQLKEIPNSSGVYMMVNKKGEVIYIGKANNLKSRVRSYLNTKSWSMRPKLYFLMPKVKEIKTFVTNSEKEALILEANLVNKYQPKYNVTLKDDKKFPWLMITYDENYPRVVPIRDVVGFKQKYPKTKNKFFGPYSDAGAMWETYKILKEGFQLRLRRKPLFKDRPCMNYYIGLCSGPCQKLISHEDYFKIVKQVEDFLLGKYDVVLKDLKKQMKESSSKLEYEKAAKIRDTIEKIDKVLEKQIIVSDDPKLSQDIFACDFSGDIMVLELLLVREGKVIAVESLTINVPKETSPKEAFEEGVKQYYSRVQDERLPNEIIVQFELDEKKQIEEWLSIRLKTNKQRGKEAEKTKHSVIITHPKKGKKLELVKMAVQNAKIALQRVLISNINEGITQKLPLQDLQNSLGLINFPHHIECFDISHLGGTGTVGSMVCFIDGKPDKSMYRKFKLRTVLNKIDDFEAMREIVGRRYKAYRHTEDTEQSEEDEGSHGVRRSFANAQDDTKGLPDLIIIDGGKGQLSAAKEALENTDVDLTKIDLISIAKKQEEVFKLNEKEPILLPRDSNVLHFLQRIRDEAHRFAITYQRDARVKETFISKLEKIPELNKAMIKRLMNYFGSLKNIQDSNLKEFAEVLGRNEEHVKDIWEKVKSLQLTK